MTQWWSTLSIRERIMVAFAATAGVCFLLWQAIIVPIGNWHSASLQRVDRASLGFDQVVLAARLHGEGDAQAEPQSSFDTATSLNSALSSSAAAFNLIISSIDGDGTQVQITLAPADPDLLYQWMRRVNRVYGAQVIEARLSRARNNGALVKADRLVFARRDER